MPESEDRVTQILAQADALLAKVRDDKVQAQRFFAEHGVDLARVQEVRQRLHPGDRAEIDRLIEQEKQRADIELERLLAGPAEDTPAKPSSRRLRQMI